MNGDREGRPGGAPRPALAALLVRAWPVGLAALPAIIALPALPALATVMHAEVAQLWQRKGEKVVEMNLGAVIAGATEAVNEAVKRLSARGLSAKTLPVACAFHSALMQPARDRLAARVRARWQPYLTSNVETYLVQAGQSIEQLRDADWYSFVALHTEVHPEDLNRALSAVHRA